MKAIVFAQWGEEIWITTQQVAEFYEVTDKRILQLYAENIDEFGSDVRKVEGEEFAQTFVSKFDLPAKARSILLWNPRAVLRLGFMLTQSQVSRAIRSAALSLISAIPAMIEQVKAAPSVETADHAELLPLKFRAKSGRSKCAE